MEDVEAIKAYVARDSAPYAVLLAERLVAAIEHVGLFPESGRVVPELNDATLREVVSGNYRIAASYRRRYEFPSRVPHSPLSLRPVHLR